MRKQFVEFNASPVLENDVSYRDLVLDEIGKIKYRFGKRHVCDIPGTVTTVCESASGSLIEFEINTVNHPSESKFRKVVRDTLRELIEWDKSLLK